MEWQTFEVWLLDEVKTIGSGKRVVEALIGRTKVKVRDRQLPGFPAARSSKIDARVWNGLKPVAVTVPKIRQRRKAK
jgi:hypothetical protein